MEGYSVNAQVSSMVASIMAEVRSSGPEPQPAQLAANGAAADAGGAEGVKLDGVVTQWSGSWGFIEFTDGRRAYVHNSACGGVPLIEGQSIVGYVVPDPRNPGKWQAQAVERVASYADDNTGRVAGVVTQWNSTYGFIQFSDGRRAYVHASACGRALTEGQAVVGLVVEDPQNPGKWQAQQVERVAASADDSGRLQGQVMQWCGGFGFLQFSDGRRAYAHSSQCNPAMLTEGETICGYVTEDPKNPGKWQAVGVERVGAAPAAAAAEPLADANGRMRAQVMQWSGSYGFIQVEDGRRAYVHNSQCGGATLREGETVFAALREDPRNPGKWQAIGVQRGGRPPPPLPVAAVVPPPAPAAIVGEAGRVEGMVTQWSEKGFGFIEFADGRRAYVHNSACAGAHLAQGEFVSATIVADGQNPGKWQAQQVRRASASYEVGTVVEWKEEGGYGFLQLADGRRAYVHRSAFGGAGGLAVGMRLQVTTKQDARNPGKWCVDQVTGLVDEAGAGASAAAAPSAPPPPRRQPAVVPPPVDRYDWQEQQPPAIEWGAREAVPGLGSFDASMRCSGVVSEWSPRGFGFAMFDDGRRAYVHTSQCGGEHLQQGEMISADIVPDERVAGKWQARNILRAGGGAGPPDVFSEGPDAKRQRLV